MRFTGGPSPAMATGRHLADTIVYWHPIDGNCKVEALAPGQRRPQCDRGRTDWDTLMQRWRDHELVCIWLCERYAMEHGFVW
jgi:hypothetical protein